MKNHRHELRFLWLGGCIGLCSGILAIIFRESITGITHLFFGIEKDASFLEAIKNTPLYLLFLIPILGGAFVSWFTNRFAPEVAGHGVPEIMDAVATKRGVIRPRVSMVKLFGSAISIGSGFSVGREGPTALIGASLGSFVGQMLKLPLVRMKMVVGCGASAGIAATFNAPLAGTAFALELIVGSLNVNQLTSIILSAMVATVVTHNYYGEFHELFTTLHFDVVSPIDFLTYAVLGVVMGFSGIIFTRMLYKSEDLVDKIKWPIWVKGGFGGLGIGLFCMVTPELAGPATWETIGLTLNEDINRQMVMWLLIIGVGKMVATSWSLAWGASGGVFAPSLIIGGALGAVYGYGLNQLFPDFNEPSYAFALVGMGAFVAGVTQAPLTAIAIIFEMTHNISIVLPAIVSSAMALGVYNHFMPASIYTMKLRRRGLNLEWGREVGVLENVLVAKVYADEVESLRDTESLWEVVQTFQDSPRSTLPVLNEDNCLVGVIALWDIKNKLDDLESSKTMCVAEAMVKKAKYLTPDQNLYDAFVVITAGDYHYLPVVNNSVEKRLLGRLSRQRLMEVYKNHLTMRGIIGN